MKVTDCALSRDLFPQDYCCLGDNENRPVKWMAVESLEQGRYTVASDVVSAGSLGIARKFKTKSDRRWSNFRF